MRATTELLQTGIASGLFPGAQLAVVDGGRAVLELAAGVKSFGGGEAKAEADARADAKAEANAEVGAPERWAAAGAQDI